MAVRERVGPMVSWKPGAAQGFTKEEVVSPVSAADGDK